MNESLLDDAERLRFAVEFEDIGLFTHCDLCAEYLDVAVGAARNIALPILELDPTLVAVVANWLRTYGNYKQTGAALVPHARELLEEIRWGLIEGTN